MQQAPDTVPDNIDALKSLLAEQAARAESLACINTQLQRENERIKAQVLTLREQLHLAIAKRYAASSEKASPDQIRLFNEAEATVAVKAAEQDAGHTPDAGSSRSVPDRPKRGRQALPAHLPRIEVIHELPESQRFCDLDGAPLSVIGQVTCEQLDIVPATIRVVRHVRTQYACRCGRCIKLAPLPGQPIPKSMAAPGLLAHVTVSKYQDALPLYRQEEILQRIGVDIPRATLANWMIQAGILEKWTPPLGQSTPFLRWFIRMTSHQAASVNVLAV